MKQVLLFSIFLCISYFAAAQALLRLNEIYSQPINGDVNKEFFEIAHDPTDTMVENSDNYVVLSYFDDGTERGVYLFDLPNKKISPGHFLVFAAGAKNAEYLDGRKFINDSTDQFFNHYSWNAPVNRSNASARKYLYTNGSWDNGTSLEDKKINNVFHPTKNDGDLVVLLLKKDNDSMKLVDGVIASVAQNRFYVPKYMLALEKLPFNLLAGGKVLPAEINFGTFAGFELWTIPAASFSTEHGYYFCSSWDQAIPTASNRFLSPNRPNTPIEGKPLLIRALYDHPTRMINVTETSGQVSPYPITVSMYYDNDKDGLLDRRNGDTKQSEIVMKSKGKTYDLPVPEGKDAERMILVIDGEGQCFDQIKYLCNPCILPVTFTYFNARRKDNKVQLNWQTATENNNKGFFAERRAGIKDAWETIAFVPSQAPGGTGNSSLALSYSLVDENPPGEVTRYRLRQVDFDGRQAFSTEVSVRGVEQGGRVVVYPNPSRNGTVNVIFDGASVSRNVVLSDLNGRVIRQWKGADSKSFQLTNLESGLYNISIQNIRTGTQTVEKVVVVR